MHRRSIILRSKGVKYTRQLKDWQQFHHISLAERISCRHYSNQEHIREGISWYGIFKVCVSWKKWPFFEPSSSPTTKYFHRDQFSPKVSNLPNKDDIQILGKVIFSLCVIHGRNCSIHLSIFEAMEQEDLISL